MEDEVVESTPTETTDEDFFDDVDQEVIKEESGEDTPVEAEKSEETEEKSEESKTEVDLSPFFNALGKEIKYNGEPYEIKSKEDLITLVQKGLNYDKKTKQYEDLENSKGVTYIRQKAKELGLTEDEYMDQVENYEREQEEARNKEKLEEMINNGVPEDVAKEVIATSQLRKQLQIKENELKAQEEAKKKEEQKQKEYQDFVEAYPDVKAEDVPKEVMESGRPLKEAYSDWLIKDLQTKLAVKEQNEKNAKSSVGSTTEQGSEKSEPKDDFLSGFDEY